jgi:hypothetical protein
VCVCVCVCVSNCVSSKNVRNGAAKAGVVLFRHIKKNINKKFPTNSHFSVSLRRACSCVGELCYLSNRISMFLENNCSVTFTVSSRKTNIFD